MQSDDVVEEQFSEFGCGHICGGGNEVYHFGEAIYNSEDGVEMVLGFR